MQQGQYEYYIKRTNQSSMYIASLPGKEDKIACKILSALYIALYYYRSK
jgi:hypothetical protein